MDWSLNDLAMTSPRAQGSGEVKHKVETKTLDACKDMLVSAGYETSILMLDNKTARPPRYAAASNSFFLRPRARAGCALRKLALKALPWRRQDVRDTLVDFVESYKPPVDLMVMGSHSKKGLRRKALGGTTSYCVKYAQCPVMVVPKDIYVHVRPSPHRPNHAPAPRCRPQRTLRACAETSCVILSDPDQIL